MDLIKPGAKFEGVCYTPYSFSFEITKRNKGQIEGEITWPSIGNAKTKVRGTIEGEEMEFEEFDSSSNDVVVPANYIGRLFGGVGKKKLGGNFKADKTTGQFELDLNSK